MNMFTAAKRLTAILAALAGIGIDASDEKTDVAAAIKAKIDEAKGSTDVDAAVKAAVEKEREAHAATTAVLREKAEMFDALEKQATESGIDLRAAAKGDGIGKEIDGKARDHAKKILGQNAPENHEIDPAPDAPPAGSDASIAARYDALVASGNKDEASRFYSAHSEAILRCIKIELPA